MKIILAFIFLTGCSNIEQRMEEHKKSFYYESNGYRCESIENLQNGVITLSDCTDPKGVKVNNIFYATNVVQYKK